MGLVLFDPRTMNLFDVLREGFMLQKWIDAPGLTISGSICTINLYKSRGARMGITVSYSRARQNLAKIWDEVEDSRDVAVIRRRGHEDMALIPAEELSSLKETAYLLKSPANAARLLAALNRARRGRTRPVKLGVLRKTVESEIEG